MVPVISFIGWHDSGKTTLVSKVVAHLKEKGLRVAVIKSTQHTGIDFDVSGSDTDTYRRAGADAVALTAPDQMILFSENPGMSLVELAYRFFDNYDIVIGEGFKHERQIRKIEVIRGEAEPLRDQVTGVIATVTDGDLSGDSVFRFDESRKIADFLVNKYIEGRTGKETALLLVNGKKIPMKGFVQDALAGTVYGFVRTLKQTGEFNEIELRISLPENKNE